MIASLLLAVAASMSAADLCNAAVDPRGFVKSQLLDCATRAMDRADAALNARYKRMMAVLPATRRERLRAEERAWIDRRRARCAVAQQAAIPSPEINRMRCLVRETDARTRILTTYR